jgi:hypothetical protein
VYSRVTTSWRADRVFLSEEACSERHGRAIKRGERRMGQHGLLEKS